MIYYKQKQVAAKDYILVTPATDSPVTLDQVKELLKITDNDSDALILSLINAATDYAEAITGRDLINKTYKGFLNKFPSCPTRNIQIRKSKLQSITSIQYYVDNVLTTLSSSEYYITETTDFATINIIEGSSWPSVDKREQAVVITFVAGYGEDQCDIPAGLKQAVLNNVVSLYEGNCEGDVLDDQVMELYKAYILSTKLVCVF